jgi:hypothetical protein
VKSTDSLAKTSKMAQLNPAPAGLNVNISGAYIGNNSKGFIGVNIASSKTPTLCVFVSMSNIYYTFAESL